MKRGVREAKRRRATSDARGQARDISQRSEAAPSTPPLWRDRWAWVSVLAVVPIVLHSLGAPLGEAVAEDFDFIHRSLLHGSHNLLDGGGSSAFWRPLAHQIYYGALGPLILAHPRAVAAIHVALLSAAALLLYRSLRPTLPGYAAASAAAFPLLADSTRTLVAWPSHFVDLGLFLFSVLAIHEASRGRKGTSLASLAAALLCKELAVVTAALIPFLPVPALGDRRSRMRWAIMNGALVAAWAAAYIGVRRHAGLELPHHLEAESASFGSQLPMRFVWAIGNSVRAIMSLTQTPGRWDLAIGVGVALTVAAAAVLFALHSGARARFLRALPWTSWGLVWFAAASATLTTMYPIWAPNRSQFGSLGLGVAASATLAAAHPALLAGMIAVRVGAFALSPGPPTSVTISPAETGAFMDFERLTRLQRLMEATRQALKERHPRLAPGSRVGQHYLPQASEYAFGGARALQVWYRDTTLRWVRFEDFRRRPELPLATIVEYQPAGPRAVALVDPDAMRLQIASYEHLAAGRWRDAIAAADRADSVQNDTTATVFTAGNAGRRAYCLFRLGALAEAEREARRALRLTPGDLNPRFTLALIGFQEGRLEEAEAQLDTLLAASPQDLEAASLLDRVRAARGRLR